MVPLTGTIPHHLIPTDKIWSPAREGVIIECPLNGQFHDARDVILTSWNDVRGFAGDDDDDEPTLGTLITRFKLLKWCFLMF